MQSSFVQFSHIWLIRILFSWAASPHSPVYDVGGEKKDLLLSAFMEGGIRPVVAVSSCLTAARLPSSSMCQGIIALSLALQLNQSWPHVNRSCSYYRAKRERDTDEEQESEREKECAFLQHTWTQVNGQLELSSNCRDRSAGLHTQAPKTELTGTEEGGHSSWN